MHYIGIAGYPRRYYSFTNFDAFNSFTDLNMFITIAAIITMFAQFIFLFNFFYSMARGRKAPPNPWGSNTLEWTTPRLPKHGNCNEHVQVGERVKCIKISKRIIPSWVSGNAYIMHWEENHVYSREC